MILVYRLTRSGLRVGVTVALEIAPVLLLGFVAGTVVDRRPRRQVMVAADLGRAAIAAVLAVFGRHLPVVYAAAFGSSALGVLFNPAAASVLPALVRDEREVVGANSAVWSAAVISQIALAPLAGGLVAWAGPGAAFAVDAASFAVSALLLAGLRLPTAPAPPPTRRLAEVVEGLRAVRDSRLLRTLAVVQGLGALSAGATSALLVVLAERHLHAGASRFGVLLAAIGVGAGFGALVLQRLISDVRRPMVLFGPFLLRGVVDLVLATTSRFAVALGALGAYGVATATGNVTFNSALQTTVPERLRGRVFTFYDMVWQTGRLVSIGVGGALADAAGIGVVYLVGGVLLLAAAAYGLMAAGGGASPGRPAGGSSTSA